MAAKEETNLAGHLSSAAIDIAALREFARQELSSALDQLPGDIALVLDPDLVGPLGLVAEVSLLKEHGVAKIFNLEPGPLVTDSKNIVYLVRPEPSLMSIIAQHFHSHQLAASATSAPPKTYTLLFVPRKTMMCERALADQGIYRDVESGELQLELLPLDDDVLTMALPGSFRSLFLDGDTSNLFYVARGILKLQKLFGSIPEIYGKGECAQSVLKLLQRMQKEEEYTFYSSNQSYFGKDSAKSASSFKHEIDSLVLIDRTADMVTPMLGQQTYEGLIDEVFGIQYGYIDIAKEALGLKGKDGKPLEGRKKLPLNSGDTVFKECRDLPFSQLSAYCKRKTAYIAQVYESRHQADTISQISEFMSKFKDLNKEHASLQNHINIAEIIATDETRTARFHRRIAAELSVIGNDENQEDFLEEIIGKYEPLPKTLRFLCLNSLLSNGLKAKRLEFFKNEIIQTYGFQHILTLDALEQLQLLKANVGRSAWPQLRKGFKLFQDRRSGPAEGKEDPSSSSDLYSLYDGYAPLSARIVEAANSAGSWAAAQELLKLLPGPQFREVHPDFQDIEFRTTSASVSAAPRSGSKVPISVVFFLGGVTMAEIAALRALSRDTNHNRVYIVATTHITTPDKLMKETIENIQSNIKLSTLS